MLKLVEFLLKHWNHKARVRFTLRSFHHLTHEGLDSFRVTALVVSNSFRVVSDSLINELFESACVVRLNKVFLFRDLFRTLVFFEKKLGRFRLQRSFESCFR